MKIEVQASLYEVRVCDMRCNFDKATAELPANSPLSSDADWLSQPYKNAGITYVPAFTRDRACLKTELQRMLKA